MSQDTRKDKRARDINVVVRYKSATVDEFIENHSFDISRGGAFIKTSNPFPPGTLLKFELRLAANEKVVSGVGRVVWKRESAQATSQNPAGMGVKFIKIDDASKAVIDNLVAQNPSAGGAFEAVAPMPSSPPPAGEPKVAAAASALPRPAPPQRTSRTIAGMPTPVPEVGGLAPKPTVPNAVAAAFNASASASASDDSAHDLLSALDEAPRKVEPAPQRATFSSRKATMMGIGVGSSAPPPMTSEAPPPPKPSEAPPAPAGAAGAAGARPEPTVMKQAAELLAEALKEAGGSMEEIEGNPLFDNLAKHGDGSQDESPDRDSPPSLRIPPEPGEEDLPTRVVASNDIGVDPSGATEPIPKQQSGDTMTLSAKAVQDANKARAAAAAAAASAPAATAKPVQATPASAEKKGGSGAIVAILGVLLLLAGGGVYAWKSGMLGGSGATIPSNTPSVVIPMETASAPATATAPLAPTIAPTAALPTATATTATTVPSAPTAPATASAAPTATATSAAVKPAPAPVDPPKPAPAPKPAPKATGEGTDPPAPPAATATPAATAAPTAAPAPAPVPVAPPPDELK